MTQDSSDHTWAAPPTHTFLEAAGRCSGWPRQRHGSPILQTLLAMLHRLLLFLPCLLAFSCDPDLFLLRPPGGTSLHATSSCPAPFFNFAFSVHYSPSILGPILGTWKWLKLVILRIWKFHFGTEILSYLISKTADSSYWEKICTHDAFLRLSLIHI